MEEINLKRLLEVALSLKWVIIGMLILMATIGSLYSFEYVVPVYESSIKILLSQVQNVSESDMTEDSITQSDLVLNNQLVPTYSEIITSKDVLKKVIENLSLDLTEEELTKKITVSSVTGTQVLKITVEDEDPEKAKNIAENLGNVFKEEVNNIYKMNNVTTIEKPEINNKPSNINHIKDIIIFEVLGIFLSFGIVLIIYLIDTTIKDEKDIETEVGVSSLGMIPLYKEDVDGEKKELLSFENSKSPITECFRTLRTNLVFARNNKNLKNILIISSISSEGKSYVTANLAMSFAKTNKKVIIIDADMRRGRQHTIFDVKNSKGLSNCLANISEFDSASINQIARYVKSTSYPNIHLITSGTRPANPLELISSDKMIELISILDKVYDYVIIDGTPTNIVSDSIALSKYVDATVLVAEYKKTKIEAINKVKKAVENVGGNITGIILNKCPVTERAYTEKYYYSEGVENSENSDNSKSEQVEVIENKTFNDLIKNVDFDKEDFEELVHVSTVQPVPVKKENEFIDYKLENISMEISSLKDLMIKIAMKSNEDKNDSYKKEIEDLKKEIEVLKSKI